MGLKLMAVRANYLISGIWLTRYRGMDHAAHVFLHEFKGLDLFKGRQVDEAEVIRLIRAGKIVQLIYWNYETGKWDWGEEVAVFLFQKREFLRSHREGVQTDRLLKLIQLETLV